MLRLTIALLVCSVLSSVLGCQATDTRYVRHTPPIRSQGWLTGKVVKIGGAMPPVDPAQIPDPVLRKKVKVLSTFELYVEVKHRLYIIDVGGVDESPTIFDLVKVIRV